MHFSPLLPLVIYLMPILASPTKPKSTPEIYYLTDCFNTAKSTSYAEIDYYKDSSKSAISGHATTPDLKAVINKYSDLDYEDSTVSTLSGAPFEFTGKIGEDAYTAKAGTVVGSANATTYKGVLSCKRLTRVVVYEPKKNVTCYSDYACVDVGVHLVMKRD
jgi:hypothetical protein